MDCTSFKVYSDNGRWKVVTKDRLQRSDLGVQILIPIPTDEICDKIENAFPVPTDLQDNISFEDFIWKVEIPRNVTTSFRCKLTT